MWQTYVLGEMDVGAMLHEPPGAGQAVAPAGEVQRRVAVVGRGVHLALQLPHEPLGNGKLATRRCQVQRRRAILHALHGCDPRA